MLTPAVRTFKSLTGHRTPEDLWNTKEGKLNTKAYPHVDLCGAARVVQGRTQVQAWAGPRRTHEKVKAWAGPSTNLVNWATQGLPEGAGVPKV